MPIVRTLSLPRVTVTTAPLSNAIASRHTQHGYLRLLLPALRGRCKVSHLILRSHRADRSSESLVFIHKLQDEHFVDQLHISFTPNFSSTQL